jgi:chromosome segregation ATPase
MVGETQDLAAAIIGLMGGGAVGAFSVWRYFRNTVSRDHVGISRDRAEAGIITVLQEQALRDRERATMAEKDRNEAMVEIGKLQGQVTALSTTLEVMKAELHETREELRAVRSEMKEVISSRDALLKMIVEKIDAGNKLAATSHDSLCHIEAAVVPPTDPSNI